MQRRRRRIVLRRLQAERPQLELAAQPEPARDPPFLFDIDGIDIVAALKRLALGKLGILEWRLCLNKNRRRNRGQVVRQQLIEQRCRELGKFALQLELHPGCHEGAAFQQAGNPRVHLLFAETTEPLGNTGKFLGKLLRSLVEDLQLAIVVFEEFAVHVEAGSRVSCTFPDPTSTSATNSIGISSGRQASSPDTTKRTR